MELHDWLIAHVDRTYQTGNWAGTGVRPALEGVNATIAAWRPHPEQHTIAELALHMAYWKDAAGARVAGRPWAYDEHQDWRTVPGTEPGWAHAQSELQAAHGRLMADLRALPANRLMVPVGPTPGQTRVLHAIDLVVDVATHDHYHAAQIFVLRRLYGTRAGGGPA